MCRRSVHTMARTPSKSFVYSVRVEHRLGRRIRGIAAVDGTTAADLTRDMLAAIFGGDNAKLLEFISRIQSAIQRHAAKSVRVPDPEGGLWSAPAAKGRPAPPSA